MSDSLIQLVCLPLYSETKADGRFIPFRNSLNMWNASGRPRHEDEIGIPVPVDFRNMYPDFFPHNMASFELRLPNLSTLSAKQCQQGGKALMSNPNKDLGKWLLRDILHIPEYTVVTYQMLEDAGIDSVYLEKWEHSGSFYYKIYPAPVNEYDRFIRGAKLQRRDVTALPPRYSKDTVIRHTDNVGPVTQKPSSPKKGSLVSHPSFGKGTVISVRGDLVEIKFTGGKKQLSYKWLKEHNCI